MSGTISICSLLSDRRHVGRTRFQSFEAPSEPAEGEVLLSTDSFALTSSNIAYASCGESLRYWDFFPTRCAGWGHMPVWGFATVYRSNVPGIDVGERFYGLFPIANFVHLKPGRVGVHGFHDLSAHRQGLPSPYNQYTRCVVESGQSQEQEDTQMLLRPLFFTSYMLADFLRNNDFFGATQVVMSSAANTAAFGTAFCLENAINRPNLVGLTSRRSHEHVVQLGLYDQVVSYDRTSQLQAPGSTLYLDFAGEALLRLEQDCLLAGQGVRDCSTPRPANTNANEPSNGSGPVALGGTVPGVLQLGWAAGLMSQRFETALREFCAELAGSGDGWITVRPGYGFEGAARVVRSLHVAGEQPHVGHVIRLNKRPWSVCTRLA